MIGHYWRPIEGTESGARFGTGLALSEDGTIVAGGIPDVDTLNGFRTGCLHIFELQGGSWVEIAVLNGEGPGDDFGQWLDVSSDGGVIAIGAMT